MARGKDTFGKWKKMNSRLQMKITSKRMKLEKCDTTFWKALEKSLLTFTSFFNSPFVKFI